jgi:hypothetical protein
MRFGKFVTGVAVVFALCVGASNASALEPHERNGFFIGFGLGAGNASWDWSFESPDSPSEGSGTLDVRIGGAIRSNVLLGLESSTWVKDYDLEAGGTKVGDAKVTFNTVLFAATWFPGNQGFYMRGGVGVGTAKGEVGFDISGLPLPNLESDESGFAALAALGYEWRLSRKFAIGPQVESFFLGVDGDIVDNVAVVDGSVQFNWYW